MLHTRPFPGISFRTETPIRVDLPRMDIAAFVGFAQRGPVDVPVVIESYPEFVDIFGGLYPLAWDREERLWQTACLAPAVKNFFVQGGRRCWIVRVAWSQAKGKKIGGDDTKREDENWAVFPLVGLLTPASDDSYTEARVVARCQGSWAADLEVKVEPIFTSLSPLKGSLIGDSTGNLSQLSLSPSDRSQNLQKGDLLQIDFDDNQNHRAYFVIDNVDLLTGTVTFSPDQILWFYRLRSDDTITTPIVQKPELDTSIVASLIADKSNERFKTLRLSIGRDQGKPPRDKILEDVKISPGDWLQLKIANQQVRLLAGNAPIVVRDLNNRLEYDYEIASIWGEGKASSKPAIDLKPLQIKRVQLELKVRSTHLSDEAVNVAISELGCSESHPRFIGALSKDYDLFKHQPISKTSIDAALRADIRSPRFPIAASSKLKKSAMIIPLGLDNFTLWASASVTEEQALLRDGLVPSEEYKNRLAPEIKDNPYAAWAHFLTDLYLDPNFRHTGQRSLISELSDWVYGQGKSLTGLHALFPVDEVSLIVLPDACHGGWQSAVAETILPDNDSQEKEGPADFCQKAGIFQPCEQKPSDASGGASAQTPSGTAAGFIVQEKEQWQLLESSKYNDQGLLAVQKAAVRLAAARADCVVILGMPKHYRLPEVQSYQQKFLTDVQQDGETTNSYGVFYHPWLIQRHEDELVHASPGGAIAGVMAAHSLSRGAWVAPANENLQGVLATLPEFDQSDQQALYTANINPIRQKPQGFVAWGNFTQSQDRELEDLNVRRLLILLRRLALREGQRYVFAPHSAAFRRRIQQQFEQLLGRLFERGAFAGDIPYEAYQVRLAPTINNQAVVEQGQLQVELRVAPSQPLTFMTVKLVQRDSNTLIVQEVGLNGR